VTPVPLNASVVGEPDALLVKLMVPVAASAVVGANFTLKAVELFGFKITGVVSPLVVKSGDPLKVASEIDKVAPPELEIVMVCVLLLPTLMFPKAAAVGFNVICGVGATTSAVIGMLIEEFVALLVKLRDAEAEPMLVGVKVTVTLSCAPPARAAGRLIPLTAKAEFVAEAAEILMLAVPGLVSVKLWCDVVPMVTLPNTMDAALLFNWPATGVSVVAFEPLPSRAHPETKLLSAKMAASAIQPRPILLVIACPRIFLAPSGTSASPCLRAPPCPCLSKARGLAPGETLVRGPKMGQLEHLYRGTRRSYLDFSEWALVQDSQQNGSSDVVLARGL
jgi:hypothetical protein